MLGLCGDILVRFTVCQEKFSESEYISEKLLKMYPNTAFMKTGILLKQQYMVIHTTKASLNGEVNIRSVNVIGYFPPLWRGNDGGRANVGQVS